MGFITKPSRIVTDDFPQEDQKVITTVAQIVNPAFEDIHRAVMGQLSFENMKWGNLNNFIIKVGTDNLVLIDGSDARLTNRIKNPVKTGTIVGAIVVKASCLDNPNLIPISTPFLSFSQNQDGSLNILGLSGIQANNRYSINIVFFTN